MLRTATGSTPRTPLDPPSTVAACSPGGATRATSWRSTRISALFECALRASNPSQAETCRKIRYSSCTATADDHARRPRSYDAAVHRCERPVRHPGRGELMLRGATRYAPATAPLVLRSCRANLVPRSLVRTGAGCMGCSPWLWAESWCYAPVAVAIEEGLGVTSSCARCRS
jgi:hypothetical protein